MKFPIFLRSIAILLGLLFSSHLYANDLIRGKITSVIPNYMPSFTSIVMDTGTSSCPAGSWVTWSNSNINSVEAVHSSLMAAFMGKKTVWVYVQPNTCTIVQTDITH